MELEREGKGCKGMNIGKGWEGCEGGRKGRVVQGRIR